MCVLSVPCVLWCVVPLFSCPSGAPLSGVSVRCCARLVPAVPPSLCAPLARPLATPCSFRVFVALYPFLYPCPWHALFPCLRFVACLGLFPCRLAVLSRWAFFFEPAKRKDVNGRAAAGVLSRHGTSTVPSSVGLLLPRGGVVCYLFMLRSCAPLSFFLPCCACYGVFFRASFGVGLYPTCSRLGSTHLFGRHLCSLSVPRARRDMQHTCFFPHYLSVSYSSCFAYVCMARAGRSSLPVDLPVCAA